MSLLAFGSRSSAAEAAKQAKPVTAGSVAVVINATTRNDAPSKETAVLAKGGKALVPIIHAKQASPATVAIAGELAELLGRISGATFEVKEGDGTSGIVLGTLAEFPAPELNEPLKIFRDYDGKEAFAIRTSAKRIRLAGNTDLGVSHAAFRLLEGLGYRHFFPAKEWEVVPKITTLTWNRDITDRPQILARDIWFEAGSGGQQQNDDYAAWKRHNRHAQSFVVNAGHNLDAVVRTFQAEFDAHPEYYALIDGKRQGPDIELANPEVRKLVLEYARKFFRENPQADMVSIDPIDVPNHSQSEESLAMGSFSDRIFGMANDVAKMLQKEFPGKMVGLYSYSGHWDPPSFKLEPNVHVLMAGLGQGQFTPAERARIWPTRSDNRGVYEYFSVFLWTYDKLPGSWVNNVAGMQERLREYVNTGVTSISAESTANWGANGRGYYVTNRLMWNPDLDLDALLEDFYTKAFGAGAAAMRRFYETLDPANAKFLSKHLLGLAYREIDAATKLTKDDSAVQARLDFLKLSLHYTALDWRRSRDPSTPPEDKAAIDPKIEELFFRTRMAAIFSWEMARQTWWSNRFPQNGADPGIESGPFTHAEIAKMFAGALKYFQPRTDIGKPVQFSDDLIPVEWGQAAPQKLAPVESKQHYQGGARYALYSLAGEPLEFTTEAGDAWGGINRWTLTDGKGNEIDKREKLPNKAVTVNQVEVPGPGLYWLDYNDNGSHWNMTVVPGKIVTLPMGQMQDFRTTQIMQEMYFYVPKGTKNLEYYYTRTNFHPGGPHQVVDPQGKVAQDVDVNGDWVSIPVPAGMDGKVWSMKSPVLGVFWFNNFPNYLASSPDALLVPREVANKDGLVPR
jgi:hypothetical protein